MTHSHVLNLLVFSALVSSVFATLLRNTTKERVRFGRLGLRRLRALDPRARLAHEPLPAVEVAAGPLRVAVVPGDGIGVEVVAEAVKALTAVADAAGREIRLTPFDWGAERYLRTGVTLPPGSVELLSEGFDAILLGAMGDPRVPDNRHAADILLGLRFKLDLYVNYRPVRLFHEKLCPLKGARPEDVDFTVFRENTEGLYVMMGGHLKKGTPDEVATEIDVNTRKGVERIVRHAFEFARARGQDEGRDGGQVERPHPRPRPLAARLQGGGRGVSGASRPATSTWTTSRSSSCGSPGSSRSS